MRICPPESIDDLIQDKPKRIAVHKNMDYRTRSIPSMHGQASQKAIDDSFLNQQISNTSLKLIGSFIFLAFVIYIIAMFTQSALDGSVYHGLSKMIIDSILGLAILTLGYYFGSIRK